MKRTKVEELEGGEILAKPILMGMGTVLVYEDTVLKKEYIEKLVELGIEEVYVKEEKITTSSTIEEQVRQEYSDKVKSLLERHVHNVNDSIGKLKDVASNIFDQIIEQKEVLDCVIEIHERSADIYEHSVSTCVMSVLIALRLGISPEDAQEIAVGGLLHDIGMRYIDVDFIDKEVQEMSSYDLSEFKKHPIYGYSAIEKEDWISPLAKSIILAHHECIDGSGFPLHTRNNDVARQIVAVCDVFDSMICGIAYKRRRVHEAMEYIRCYSGSKYNKEVCDNFLEFIFLYPNGTKVLLSDGRTAVITGQNKALKERPVVRIEATGEIIDMMEIKNIFIEKVL